MHIVKKKKKKLKAVKSLKLKVTTLPTNSANVKRLTCIVSGKNNIPFVYIRGIMYILGRLFKTYHQSP